MNDSPDTCNSRRIYNIARLYVQSNVYKKCSTGTLVLMFQPEH
jgi:hypothetical protein